MPGNLSAAVVSVVLPQSLCTAFTETRSFPLLSVGYHDGRIERGLIVDGVNASASIRTWVMAKRLATADLVALRTFWESMNGSAGRFYFYNPIQPAFGQPVGSNYDANGASVQGRHICMFTNSQWNETQDIGRSVTQIELMEVA